MYYEDEETFRNLWVILSPLMRTFKSQYIKTKVYIVKWVYYFISPLQEHLRKVVGGFGKKSFVSTDVRKSGNTCASPTAMI